jgi:hypothetical protein
MLKLRKMRKGYRRILGPLGVIQRDALDVVWKKVDGQWRLHQDIWNAKNA